MKVTVAMSGGVDSSVCAYILKEQGFDVSGITLNLYKPNSPSCGSLQNIKDAKNVCDMLGIKHEVIDMQNDFAKEIIDNFTGSYMSAKTPNPCILCNEKIKLGLLLEHTKKNGIDYLATGHYAAIEKTAGQFKLKIPKDKSKDQTYFLYRLSQKKLSQLLFPLGDYTKNEIRNIAAKAKLEVAKKPDSQEICFINTTYGDFLEKNIKDFQKRVLPGLIVDSKGKKLGRHKGLIYYTIGQRSGLGITTPEPVYVLRLDVATNTVVVGPKKEIYSRTAQITDINFISDKHSKEFRAYVKIRRMHEPALATVNNDIILFDQPQASITPGQSAVFYDGDYVLGGGFIE